MEPYGGDASRRTGGRREHALDFIIACKDAGIFHLKDFHEPLRDSAEIRRRLRDVHESCLDQHKFVVITFPVRFIPEEVERSVLFVELRSPDFAELVEFLREKTQLMSAGAHNDTSEDVLHRIARALLGLTLDEARYALRRALAAGNLWAHFAEYREMGPMIRDSP
jgi:hypothetical protein